MELATRNVDIRLAAIAGLSVLISCTALVAGLTGHMPSGASTLVVLVGVSVGLRIAWSYTAKSASSQSRARTTRLISNVGLGISLLALCACLPRITQAAGMQRFIVDVCSQLWTMMILMLVTNRVRTLGWRPCAGAALTGFLALTGLARFVGRPVIDHLGESSVLAVAVWVPLTEELFKMIPVAIVLLLALRRSDSRPAAVDAMLLGGWTGAGFAACESATLGRGGFSLLAHPATTLIFPSENTGAAFGWTIVQSGHMVHTTLIALAVALAAFYGRRLSRSWIVPVVAVVAVLLEHCSQNAMVANGLGEVGAKIAIALSLGGRLSALLLIAAAAFAVVFEWRIVKGPAPGAFWAPLQPAEAARRSALLAHAQTKAVP